VKHALTLNLNRFNQIDNEQYNSHTDTCTVYKGVRKGGLVGVKNPFEFDMLLLTGQRRLIVFA